MLKTASTRSKGSNFVVQAFDYDGMGVVRRMVRVRRCCIYDDVSVAVAVAAVAVVVDNYDGATTASQRTDGVATDGKKV